MPQSRAAMAVARTLGPQPGEHVLDLCAAPGGKTTHLAALMGDRGRVVAVERHPGRADALARTAARMGATSVEVRTADAAEPQERGAFDRVLVDPPCSDLGTLAARPDARWRKDAATVAELAADPGGDPRRRRAGASVPAASSSTPPARSRRPRTSARSPLPGAPPRLRGSTTCRPTSRSGTIRACHVPADTPAPGRHGRILHRAAAGEHERRRSHRPRRRLPGVPRAVAAPTNLPGRYRCVNCLHRFELLSVCPNCGEHSTIVRMSSTALYACNHCQSSMLQPI